MQTYSGRTSRKIEPCVVFPCVIALLPMSYLLFLPVFCQEECCTIIIHRIAVYTIRRYFRIILVESCWLTSMVIAGLSTEHNKIIIGCVRECIAVKAVIRAPCYIVHPFDWSLADIRYQKFVDAVIVDNRIG